MVRDTVETRERKGETGSSLIAVFWLMAVLSLAVFTTTHLVSDDMNIIIAQKKSFRADQLAEMGIALAMNPAVESWDPILAQQFEGAQGFEAMIKREGGRLNINSLLLREDRLPLEDLFRYWGLENDQASEVVDALLDWIDGDDLESLNGAEVDYYTEIGYENYPFNRPFYDIEEVALVRGMDMVSEFEPDWRDFFTLWSEGKLNLNEASAELIEVIVDVSANVAEEFVYDRAGYDGIERTEDDVVFASVDEALVLLGANENTVPGLLGRLSVNDNTVRIESTANVGDYLKTVVLIVRNRESQPVILSREELFYR
jgi:general secretion pathway protein K